MPRPGYIVNPSTGKLVKKKGKIGQEILKAQQQAMTRRSLSPSPRRSLSPSPAKLTNFEYLIAYIRTMDNAMDNIILTGKDNKQLEVQYISDGKKIVFVQKEKGEADEVISFMSYTGKGENIDEIIKKKKQPFFTKLLDNLTSIEHTSAFWDITLHRKREANKPFNMWKAALAAPKPAPVKPASVTPVRVSPVFRNNYEFLKAYISKMKDVGDTLTLFGNKDDRFIDIKYVDGNILFIKIEKGEVDEVIAKLDSNNANKIGNVVELVKARRQPFFKKIMDNLSYLRVRDSFNKKPTADLALKWEKYIASVDTRTNLDFLAVYIKNNTDNIMLKTEDEDVNLYVAFEEGRISFIKKEAGKPDEVLGTSDSGKNADILKVLKNKEFKKLMDNVVSVSGKRSANPEALKEWQMYLLKKHR